MPFVVGGAIWTNISATPADITLTDGIYALTVSATTPGTIDLKRVPADGSTPVNVTPQLTAAGFVSPIYLPAGNYRLVLAGTIGLSGELVRLAIRTH